MLYILCFIFQMGMAFTMKCIRQWRRMIFTQYTYPPVTISQIPLSTLKGFILQLFSTRWNSNFSQINIFNFSDFEMSFLNFLLEQQQRSDHWPVEISITKSKKTYPISILLLLQKNSISLNSYLKISRFLHFWDANNIFLIQYQLHIADGLFAQLWPREYPSDYFSPHGHETAQKCQFPFSFILFILCLLLL